MTGKALSLLKPIFTYFCLHLTLNQKKWKSRAFWKYHLLVWKYNSPRFENTGGCPSYIDIWERQSGFGVLHWLYMALVNQQDNLLWLVVDDWYLWRQLPSSFHTRTNENIITSSKTMVNLPHGSGHHLSVVWEDYSPKPEDRWRSQSHTLNAGSHSLILKGNICPKRRKERMKIIKCIRI